MNRVDEVWKNKEYQRYLALLEMKEKNRFFCKHNLAHCLDVARIAYIHCLEQKIEIAKDIIYVSALLHDIGRVAEKEENNHELLSWQIAQSILAVGTYSDHELEDIKKAILGHRNEKIEGWPKIFRQADKEARNCYQCEASKECNWSEEKKNHIIAV